MPPHPACFRSLLACLLCCECQDPLHPQEPDPPLPSYPSSACHSLAPLQGAVERPRTILPFTTLCAVPLGHRAVATGVGQGRESVCERGSVAGLSCSTLSMSERGDMRWLLPTTLGQRQAPSSSCPPFTACLECLLKNT